MDPLRTAIVGVGKIARDRHIPALRSNPAFALVACADPGGGMEGLASFTSVSDMLERRPDIDAVAICTPPQARYLAASLALEGGWHVLLEKPPCETPAQLQHLERLAESSGRTLFLAWHSRHAAGVDVAARWLRPRNILSARVTWKEDVRRWHPGQSWIWQAGGFGVFDPGINAISILTRIVPRPVSVTSARLYTPANRNAPIAADLTFETDRGARIEAAFDFRQSDEQTWDIEVETDGGSLKLSAGGAALAINGEPVEFEATDGEYPSLYRRFAELIQAGTSEVDGGPLQLVVDAFAVAERFTVEPFED